MDSEAEVYGFIQGFQIGPTFLGHLTEEGRVIGFILSRVTDYHHATADDLPACRSALSKLHALGIEHVNFKKENFLI